MKRFESNAPQQNMLDLISRNSSVVYIYESYTDTSPLIVSKNIESILGYPPSLFETKQLEFDSLVHPDDREQYRTEYRDVSASIDKSEVVHTDYRFLSSKNDYIWIKENRQLQFNEHGDVLASLSLITDQSDKHAMLDDLASSKKRLELAMTTSGIGIWEWDLTTDKVKCDAGWSSIMGFTSPVGVIKVSRIYAMVHDDDVMTLKNSLIDYISGKAEHFEEVVRMRHLNGTWRYILNRGVIFKYAANGTPLHFIGSHTDITLQKETELAALAALGSRNQFFARVSHEIRTPMHGILGILGLLKNKVTEPEAHKQLLTIEQSSEQLLFLLNDILDLAKLNETKLKVNAELTSITEVMSQVERLFRDKAEQKKLRFRCDYPRDRHDYLMIDKVRLTQVLSNLISNSIKYTHSGFVTVACLLIESDLYLEVADSGIGIKDTSRVFEPYTQEGGAYSQGSSSTGLGLDIVKKLCDLMGIKTKVVSDGSGTRFTLNLGKPVMPKNNHESIPSEMLEQPTNITGKRILVVDDSDINCEIACGMLAACGALTERAGDGYMALKTISQQPNFDVILMDKHMPNMNGIEATRSIMSLYVGKQAPIVIALTADAFDIDSKEWFACGLTDLLTKPFDSELLLQTVSRALRKRDRK